MTKKASAQQYPSSSQSMIQGAMVLTAALAIVKIIGFLYKIPQTAILGGDGMGVYAQAYDFYGIVYAVAVTGFPAAISKIVVGYYREGRYLDIRRTIRIANYFFLSIGIVASLVLFFFSGQYAVSVMQNDNVRYAIIAVAPSVVFSSLMCTHRGFNQGMRNMVPTAVSQVIEVIAKSVVGLLAAYWLKTVLANEWAVFGTVFGSPVWLEAEAQVLILSFAAAGSIFGVTVSTFVGWLFLAARHKVKGDGITEEMLKSSPAAETDAYLLKQILRVGIPVAIGVIAATFTGLVNTVVIQRRIIHLLSEDPETVFASHYGWLEWKGKTLGTDYGEIATFLRGCYSYGYPFFNLVSTITGSFCMSALPHIADAYHCNDMEKTKKGITSTIKMVAIVAAPMGMGLAMLGTPILHLLYSRAQAEVAIGGPILSWLGVASVFLAISGAVTTVLQALGRYDIPAKLQIAGGILNVLTTYVLVGIPTLNIKAAAVGMLVGNVTITILSLYALQRETRFQIDWKDALAMPLLAGTAAGAVAFLSYFLQTTILYHLIRQKVATVISILLAVIFYVIIVIRFAIQDHDELRRLPGGKKIADLLEKRKGVR